MNFILTSWSKIPEKSQCRIRTLLLFLFLAFPGTVYATGDDSTKHVSFFKIKGLKAVPLPTHPFGIFSLRIANDFSFEGPGKPTLHLSLNSGNIWSPPVNIFRPVDREDASRIQNLVWHVREFAMDREHYQYKKISYAADGVLKELRIDANHSLGTLHEIGITGRTYLLAKGNMPTAFITSDSFIEWFHSNIAGGEDPFARKVYGFDQAGVLFTDEQNRSLKIKENSSFLGAIELHHYYYPKFFRRKNFSLKTGTHFSIFNQKYNASADGGVSLSMAKRIRLKKNKALLLGLNPAFVKRRVISINERARFFNTNSSVNLQTALNYSYSSKNYGVFGIDLSYYYQSPYRREQETAYLIYEGTRYTSHWHLSASHLYRSTETWTLSFNHSKKLDLSVYLQQDFKVHNVPDFQAGMQLYIPLTTIDFMDKEDGLETAL